MPSLAYVPYILTVDPYYLEELQLQSNWDWGSLPPSYRSTIAQTWAEAFEITQNVQKLTVADPNTWNPSDMTYLTYTRGALVYAQRYGTPGADASLAWATGQLTAKGWTIDYKWRLAV